MGRVAASWIAATRAKVPYHLIAERFQCEPVVEDVGDTMGRCMPTFPVACAISEVVPSVTYPGPACEFIGAALNVLPEFRLPGCSIELCEIASDDVPSARRLGNGVRNRMRATPVTVPHEAVMHVLKLRTQDQVPGIAAHGIAAQVPH